ncbi:MAG TPA: hypothetical protein VHG10_08515, partial [Glycomyces sp.]|nr:hypothetical protein [Glycomyces sp.]
MTAIAPEHSSRSGSPVRAVLRRWPTAAGIAMAAFVAWGLTSGAELAPILAASGFVYLGAAAIGKRGAAWPMFLLTFVVISAAKLTPFEGAGVGALFGVAVLFTVYGLVRGAARPAEGLPLQGVA